MKKRLDLLMVERKLVAARSKAERLIKDGQVEAYGRIVTKPGTPVEESAEIRVTDGALRYVSRGGLKLERAIESFGIALGGAVAMDIGASTGGFTDCMLQNGAKRVYAVDVGSGQLAEKLRSDERVVNLENVNARYLSKDIIPETPDFASVDVSFISLRLVLPAVTPLIKPDGAMVCLIKPQFEAGRENLNKHGVVKDRSVHSDVIDSVCGFVGSLGWKTLGLDYSPVKGPEGNIEYLIYIAPGSSERTAKTELSPDKTVERAHAALD